MFTFSHDVFDESTIVQPLAKPYARNKKFSPYVSKLNASALEAQMTKQVLDRKDTFCAAHKVSV